MSKITFTDDAGNVLDVALPAGVMLNVAPPIAPLVASFKVSMSGLTATVVDRSVGGVAPLKVHYAYADGKTADCAGGETLTHDYPDTSQRKIVQTVTDAAGTTATSCHIVYPTEPGSAPPPQPPPSDPPPVTPPPRGAAGSVALKGTFADSTTIDLSVDPGERVPMGADATRGSIICHADGRTACIENAYAGLLADLTGHFTLTGPDGALFDGDLTIWKYARTRPFRLVPLAANPNADLSKLPRLDPNAGKQASMVTEYQSAPRTDPTDHWPLHAGIGAPGEHDWIGDLTRWAACYLTNPTADNAMVMAYADSATCLLGFHAIDFATQKKIDLTGNPNVSMLWQTLEQGGNPFLKGSASASSLNLDGAYTHAPTWLALSCALFGDDFFREELTLWANYVGGLWQNWNYRLPDGCISARGASRGIGRTLNALEYASIYSSDTAYFDTWVKALSGDLARRLQTQTGIAIDQAGAEYEGYPNDAFAPYQESALIKALGLLLDHGRTEIQPAFDTLAPLVHQMFTQAPPELAVVYNARWKDASGNVATDWLTALQWQAQNNAALRAALQCPAGSQALQDAMHSRWRPGSFVGDDPSKPENYPAQLQGAVAKVADHWSDRVKAAQVWPAFEVTANVNPIDYSKNPKYALVPRGV